jgi:tRNA threonylcarbamoyladenosine biosynthesis protein TsaE
MREILLNSIEDLPLAAQMFCKNIGRNRVFLFYGEMGAGKTTFIKAICKELEVKQEVTSPTFAIVNEYVSEKYPLIFHFDFYRINKTSEIFDIGFEEYISSDALIFIEWPEKMSELIPSASIEVKITELDNNKRLIILQ